MYHNLSNTHKQAGKLSSLQTKLDHLAAWLLLGASVTVICPMWRRLEKLLLRVLM